MSDNKKERSDTKSHIRRESGRYANVFQIGYNSAEFLIEFGQDGSGIHTRVYVSPQHAHILSDLLSKTLLEHQKAFGPIMNPNASGTDIQ